jgi:hypothetical protein
LKTARGSNLALCPVAHADVFGRAAAQVSSRRSGVAQVLDVRHSPPLWPATRLFFS